MKMDEVALLVSDVDDGLRERLDQEIYAFNVAATGQADGRLLSIAVRGRRRGAAGGSVGMDMGRMWLCGVLVGPAG